MNTAVMYPYALMYTQCQYVHQTRSRFELTTRQPSVYLLTHSYTILPDPPSPVTRMSYASRSTRLKIISTGRVDDHIGAPTRARTHKQANVSPLRLQGPESLETPRDHMFTTRRLELELDVGLGLAIERVPLAGHLEVVRGLVVADDALSEAVGGGGLDPQLHVAGAVQEPEHEAGLVDGLADGQEPVVHEDHALVGAPERRGYVLALLGAEHDAPVPRVHGVRVVEVANVLVQHLEGSREDAPGTSGIAVGVADGVDCGTSLV